MTERHHLTPEDWIEAAVEALLKEGPAGLRIARLAQALGVTPGSFYWHFKNRGQFRARVLEYWMNKMIAGAGDAAQRAGPGQAQIRALPGILLRRGLPQYDVAMRKWAASDSVVAAAVDKADQLRARRVAAMFEEAGFSEEAALKRSRIVGWTFFGSTGTDMEVRSDAMATLIDLLLRDAPK